jgi:hypothetical protein
MWSIKRVIRVVVFIRATAFHAIRSRGKGNTVAILIRGSFFVQVLIYVLNIQQL